MEATTKTKDKLIASRVSDNFKRLVGVFSSCVTVADGKKTVESEIVFKGVCLYIKKNLHKVENKALRDELRSIIKKSA